MTATVYYPDYVKIYAYLNNVWVDITDDHVGESVTTASANWGISGTSPTDLVATTGTLNFALLNRTGKYLPGLSTALSGWGKGTKVKLVVTYLGIDYIRFYGIVYNIVPSSTPDELENVIVTVYDWMTYASNYPLTTPQIELDKRADEAISTIVSDMPIQPLDYEYDTGAYTFPSAFDTITSKTKAITEFQKLALSEYGRIYVRKSQSNGEKLIFEGNHYRNGLQGLSIYPKPIDECGNILDENGYYITDESGNYILNDETSTMYLSNPISVSIKHGDNLINRIALTTYPKKVDTITKVLYSLSSTTEITSGKTLTIKSSYTDPDGGATVNAISDTMISPTLLSAYTIDANTYALLHFNGSNGSTTITDEYGTTWSSHNGACLSTSIKKLGTASCYFDGTDDYVTSVNSGIYDFGYSDFTIDWWEYRTSSSNGNCSIARNSYSEYSAWQLGFSNGSNLKGYMSKTGSDWDIGAFDMGEITLNEWVHFAIVRDGSQFYAFKNGDITDKWTSTYSFVVQNYGVSIGLINSSTTPLYFEGYIDELRITNGIARWTSAFSIGDDYSMNTEEDGSGTDISSYLSVTAVYGTEAVIYTLTNNYGNTGYITSLQARGYGVYQYSSVETDIESSVSYNKYGYQDLSLSQQYQQENIYGSQISDRILELNKNPITNLRSITINANKSSESMMTFLNVDIGDLIHIVVDKYEIDNYYYIQHIAFEITEGGRIINYSITPQQSYSLQSGLELVGVDFGGSTTLDGINYGYIPEICDLSERTFTAWITPKSDTAISVIMGTNADTGGNRIYYYTYSHKIGIYTNIFQNGTPGTWTTPDNSITDDLLYSIIVTYLPRSTIAYPIIYINGIAQSLVKSSTPSGTLNTEAGSNFVIGNMKTTTIDFTKSFNGQISDARVYNRILTADEALQLYTEGISGDGITEGMVFQGPCIRSSELSTYTDLTLTSETKLLDNIYGNVGTPNGSPISRDIS
jgi:hypothetical protein